MNYDKGALRAKALEVKQLHLDKAKARQAREQADYAKRLKQWQDTGKAEALRRLTAAVAATKKDLPVDGRLDYSLPQPPAKPKTTDCECLPAVQKLDGLVELLDTMSDDEISATALSRAGIKDIAALLRRPC